MTKLKCPKCNHEWDYKGKASFATCPSCLSKVKVIKEEDLKMNAALAFEQIALRLHTTYQLGEAVSTLATKLKKHVNIVPESKKMSVNKDHHFSNTYIIELPLDSAPNHVWQDIFERIWKSSRDVWDRKLTIVDNKLRLITTLDNIEEKLDWIKHVIEQTNKAIDEYYQKTEGKEKTPMAIAEQQNKKQISEKKAGIQEARKLFKRKFG
jgi:Fe-S cluster biosynthesis and repair protein YggX